MGKRLFKVSLETCRICTFMAKTKNFFFVFAGGTGGEEGGWTSRGFGGTRGGEREQPNLQPGKKPTFFSWIYSDIYIGYVRIYFGYIRIYFGYIRIYIGYIRIYIGYIYIYIYSIIFAKTSKSGKVSLSKKVDFLRSGPFSTQNDHQKILFILSRLMDFSKKNSTLDIVSVQICVLDISSILKNKKSFSNYQTLLK